MTAHMSVATLKERAFWGVNYIGVKRIGYGGVQLHKKNYDRYEPIGLVLCTVSYYTLPAIEVVGETFVVAVMT